MSGRRGSWAPTKIPDSIEQISYKVSCTENSLPSHKNPPNKCTHAAANERNNIRHEHAHAHEKCIRQTPGYCPERNTQTTFTITSDSMESLECSSGSDELSSGYTSTTDGLALDVQEEHVQEALDQLNKSIEAYNNGLQMIPCYTENQEHEVVGNFGETDNSLSAGICLNPANLPVCNKLIGLKQRAYSTLDAKPRHEHYVNSVAPGRLKRSRPSLDILRNAIVVSTHIVTCLGLLSCPFLITFIL